MKTLPEIEARFAAAILTNETAGLDGIIAESGIAPAGRLRIYRNNFLISLSNALAATFPVLRQLVGEDYFAQTARHFICAHPPTGAVLIEYGEDFPSFLARAAGSAEFGYLIDVGALEWTINHAWQADDVMPAGAELFSGVPAELRRELVLAPHPSARLVVSDYPVLDIWRANQSDADRDLVIDLGSGGVAVLVWRFGIDVVWRVLGPAEAAFVDAILDMHTLSKAAELAAETGIPHFDAGAFCSELLASGLFIGRFLPAHS